MSTAQGGGSPRQPWRAGPGVALAVPSQHVARVQRASLVVQSIASPTAAPMVSSTLAPRSRLAGPGPCSRLSWRVPA